MPQNPVSRPTIGFAFGISAKMLIIRDIWAGAVQGAQDLDVNLICFPIGDPTKESGVYDAICNYLASPNGTIDIHYNATGCNTQQEVEDACDAIWGITDINMESEVIIYPNPAKEEIFISIKNGVIISQINICNQCCVFAVL